MMVHSDAHIHILVRHFCTPNLHIFNLFTTVWVSGRPNFLMHNSPRPTIEVGAPFCQLPNCICYCHRHHYYGGNFATMTKPMIETFLINSNFRCKHYPFQLVCSIVCSLEERVAAILVGERKSQAKLQPNGNSFYYSGIEKSIDRALFSFQLDCIN